MADFFGNSTNNDFVGTAFLDNMYGGGGNDTLTGNGGLDNMYGGLDNDTFRYLNGEDGLDGEVADGGSGSDRVLVNGAGVFDLREMDFSSVEEVEFGYDGGGTSKFVYLGSVELDGPGELAQNLVIDGSNSETDTLRVYINQSAFDVDISLWNFQDWESTDVLTIDGDASSNNLTGSNITENYISGGAGNDFIRGLNGNDTLYGGDDNDRIEGGNDNDTLYGGNHDDSLRGNNGSDTVYGGDGNDLIIVAGGEGIDGIDGGAGSSDHLSTFNSDFFGATFNFLTGQINGAGMLTGIEIFDDSDTGGNTIVSQGSGGTYFGNGGDDTFVASSGAETAYGGSGNDTLDLSPGNFNYTLDMNVGVPVQYPGELFLGFETVIFGSDNDNLTGTANADTVYGGGGNDWFTPGTGDNSVDGDGGIDMVSYVDAAAGITANLAAGTVSHDGFTDAVSEVENITGSATGSDFITGDIAANRIRGLGNYDWLTGSGGGDTFEGGDGRDMVSYVSAATGVTVNLGTGQGTAGQATGDTYISVERVTGSIFGDLIFGSNGADDFRGLGGDDWFVGSGGGRDRYDGGTADDTVAYSNSASGIIASLLLGRGTAGDAGQDLYTSIENLTGSSSGDVLTGDGGRNILRGLFGQDTLLGNGGVDRLEGGGSNDSLDGGSGFDYAVFSNNRADYQISTVGNVTTVDFLGAGGDGIDTIRNVEVLRFADIDVIL